MLERRRHDRSRAFAAGTVRQGRSGRATDCVVRNLSEGGALLLLDAPQGAPADVVLAVAGDAKPATIVWRGERGVGVAFAPAGAPTNVVSIEDARRLRAGDEARLAARIARFVERPKAGGPA